MEAKYGGGRKRSSLLFPYEPESERGTFIQFMEKSGTNAILIEALRALYECPEKPDTPILWLADYFRQFAPNRRDSLKETKNSLRTYLLDLEALILHMKDELHEKEGMLRKLHKLPEEEPCCLPDKSEIQQQQKFETQWLISPDPFIKPSCSEEELLPKQDADLSHDLYSMIHPPGLLGEDEGEVEEGEWINVCNVYKKTSQLPKTESQENEKKEEEKNEEEEMNEEILIESEPIDPDSLPPNYWIPGFTLEAQPQDLAPDESESENQIGYYRPSRGTSSSRFLPRPQRPDIIYENVWEFLLNKIDNKGNSQDNIIPGPSSAEEVDIQEEEEDSPVKHLQTSLNTHRENEKRGQYF